MATTINVKTPAQLKKAYSRIAKGLQGPFKSTRRMFVQLGAQIDRDSMLTFKNEGNYQGRSPWPKFSKKTLQTPLGTWKIRYGTDKKPKRTAEQLAEYKTKKGLWYRPGPMPGYLSDRRYGPNSKLLQASGSFRNTFKILQINNERMRYGTKHPLADKIMRRRPVIQYLDQDRQRYTKTILNWWKANTKI